jgi:2'-5' RNA ligase
MSDERLFVACDVPLIARQWIHDAIDREAFDDARWITLENQHITLRFLGATSSERAPLVMDACAAAADAHGSARVRVDGLGVFPSLRRAAVLWAGVRDESRVLTKLAAGLDDVLEELGWDREKRSFTPHVTLARFRRPQRMGALPKLPSGAPDFDIDSLTLYRSRLHPKGSRYEVIGRFPLS